MSSCSKFELVCRFGVTLNVGYLKKKNWEESVNVDRVLRSERVNVGIGSLFVLFINSIGK